MNPLDEMRQRARRYRGTHDLTQGDMAEKLHLSRQSYHVFESGKGGMHPARLDLLATILDGPDGAPAPVHTAEDPYPQRPTLDDIKAAIPFPTTPGQRFACSLAAELRILADMIINQELSGETKARRFTNIIAQYHQASDEYARALKKLDQPEP